LNLPNYYTSEAFTEAAKKAGVLVSSSVYFNANQQRSVEQNNAIRLSLTSTKTEDELVFGLNIIKKLLKQER
jgi:DNA-binding transcriptional MocR family regulator